MTTASYFIEQKGEKESIDLKNIISELFMEPSRDKAAKKLLFTYKTVLYDRVNRESSPLFFTLFPQNYRLLEIKYMDIDW